MPDGIDGKEKRPSGATGEGVEAEIAR